MKWTGVRQGDVVHHQGADRGARTLRQMGDVITVRLPHDLLRRLDRLATATQRTSASLVLDALEAHVERLERDQRLLAEAQDARSGRVPARPADTVYARLGIPSPSAEEVAGALSDVE